MLQSVLVLPFQPVPAAVVSATETQGELRAQM